MARVFANADKFISGLDPVEGIAKKRDDNRIMFDKHDEFSNPSNLKILPSKNSTRNFAFACVLYKLENFVQA